MPRLNDHYLKLAGAYLFPEIDRRVTEYLAAHPEARERLIKCGIGDVTEPLPLAVREAMHRAIDEMGERATFRGYGPPLGYDFLRDAIVAGDFAARGLDITADEIYISDGSKPDCGAILDILGPVRVAITDPVYPVYVDTNVMTGRTGPARAMTAVTKVSSTSRARRRTDSSRSCRDEPVDVVYLCYPNNPTGGMITHDQLARWVEWALERTMR